MRTGVSALGCVEPERDDHNVEGARDIADRLLASLGSMLLYWHHFANSGKRIEVETDDDSIGGHAAASAAWQAAERRSWCARCTPRSIFMPSMNSTPRPLPRASSRARGRISIPRSRAPSARCAAPSMAAPMNSPLKCRAATPRPDEAEADISKRLAEQGGHHRLRPSGLHGRPIRATGSSRRWRAGCRKTRAR